METIASFLCDVGSVDRQEALSGLFSSSSSATSEATTLAVNDLVASSDAAVIVLCGSSCLDSVTAAANVWRILGRSVPIVVSGGVGHSTPQLYDAVSRRSDLMSQLFSSPSSADLEKLSEAEIFAKILTTVEKVPSLWVFLETKSTNCGANAELAVPVVVEALSSLSSSSSSSSSSASQRRKHTMCLIQDPTMQRRSRLSFERHFAGVGDWSIRSVCTPFSVGHRSPPPYTDPARYASLLLGEIPRLRNDEQGYGPRGKNFIGECEIPKQVEGAFRVVSAEVAQRNTRQIS